MPEIKQKDLIVIGAGPGGYSAAFRAADLGRTVDLIDSRAVLGGVCLNEGCIPSKALLHATDTLRVAQEASDFGITFGKAKIDIKRLRSRTETVINTLTSGLSQIANRRKVSCHQAEAHFISETSIAVQVSKNSDDRNDTVEEVWQFKSLIVATGSSAIKLPGWPEDKRIWDAAVALEVPEIPQHLIIVGGGIIGLEMACIYLGLGSQVSVIEATARIATGCDQQAAQLLRSSLEARGCTIHTDTCVVEVNATKQNLTLNCESAGQALKLKGSHVLQSVGRKANTQSLQSSKAGLKLDSHGQILIDSTGRSNIANVYAVGDVTGGPMLAHRAVHQGHIAAEACSGENADWNDALVPSVAYTQPEVAWVGLSVADARATNIECKSTTFPWAANGRSLAHGSSEGFTTLVYAKESGRIIGATLVGENAGELIAEITHAIEMGSNLTDIAHTVHAHPTRSETIGMAAQLALGFCIDL